MGPAIGAAGGNAVRYSWVVLRSMTPVIIHIRFRGNSEATDPGQCIL